MQHRSIKSLMFHANDKDRHTVTWGPVAKGWMLENKFGLCDGGDRPGIYNDLVVALCDLTDCLDKPIDLAELTVTDNPYGE